MRACAHKNTVARNKLQGEIGCSDVIAAAVVVVAAMTVEPGAQAIFSRNSTNTRTC